jgi:hypothetical protein
VLGPATAAETLPLANTSGAAAVSELAGVVRGAIPGVIVEARLTTHEMLVRGTGEEIESASWLVAALDKPQGAQPRARMEFSLPPAESSVIRVFYLQNAETREAVYHVHDVARTILRLRWSSVCAQPRALVIAGTREQGDAAEWLIDAIDQPLPYGPAAARRTLDGTPRLLRMADTAVPLVEVFPLSPYASTERARRIVLAISAITLTPRVANCNLSNTVAVAGTAEQISAAAWLVSLVDDQSPPPPRTTREFRFPASNTVAVAFYMDPLALMAWLLETAQQIRVKTGITRLIVSESLGIIIAGSDQQVGIARELIVKRNWR